MSKQSFVPYNMAIKDATFTLALSIIAEDNHTAEIPVDPHLLAVLVDSNNQAFDFIYWDNPESSGLKHLEDAMDYTDGGEEISVQVGAIPPNAERIIFLLTTDSPWSPGHTLSSLLCLSPLYCTNKLHQEIGIYRHHELGESANLQIAEMVRQKDKNWQLTFQPVPLAGSLIEVLAQFGIIADDD